MNKLSSVFLVLCALGIRSVHAGTFVCPVVTQGTPMGCELVSSQNGQKGGSSMGFSAGDLHCPSIAPPMGISCFRVLLCHVPGKDQCHLEGWSDKSAQVTTPLQSAICSPGYTQVPDGSGKQVDQCVLGGSVAGNGNASGAGIPLATPKPMTAAPTSTPVPAQPASGYGTGSAYFPLASPSSTSSAAQVLCPAKSVPGATLRGDMNCDGKLSAIDVALLQTYINGKAAIRACSNLLITGDVDGNGTVDENDVQALKNAILGKCN